MHPGAVVYDVGGHVGFHSLGAARLGATVFAFEADPANVARLRRNGGLGGREINVVHAAVWDTEGEVALIERESSSEAHVTAGVGVPAITLDTFAAAHSPPTLVKIDVEGSEGRVLAGAARLLAEVTPIVVCEVHGVAAEQDVRDALASYRLVELGSRWRLLALPSD